MFGYLQLLLIRRFSAGFRGLLVSVETYHRFYFRFNDSMRELI